MKKSDISVVILAGGLGTRLREETEFRPKPMVPIGGKPILWHIMKIYSNYGFKKFIICLGYKGDVIKDFFRNYHWQGVDITVHTRNGRIIEHQESFEDWQITLVETGKDCFTGGRVARASKYIDSDTFMLTYGDGVADVNIDSLLEFHNSHGKMATLTGVKNPFRFGNLKINENNKVEDFLEKKAYVEQWINGGFFVFKKEFLGLLSNSYNCILEREPLVKSASNGELMVYKHHGFWHCMDTIRDHEMLNEMWKNGVAKWRV